MDEVKWFEGVKLWYNDQDYLGAIEIWQEALDALDWGVSDGKLILQEHENEVPKAILEDAVSFGVEVARRLLFLAGCQLDAQNVPLARRSLVRSLRCCTDWDSTVARRALQEWLCSYEEEAHVQNNADAALNMSRKIVEFAIHKGCNQWRSPWQRPGFLEPTVRDSEPFYDADDRPSWCHILETNWEKIRDEFLNLARGGSSTQHWPAVGTSDHREGAGQHDHIVVDGDWREVVLFGSGAQPHLAPFTSSLMRKYIPDATTLADQGGGEIIFSVLGSKTRVRAHCGSTNLRLTAHLGLSIPSLSVEDCGIRVADKWHSWKNGKVFVFDDSYEHEVKNMTSAYRAVLLLRFWHPALDPEKRTHVLLEAVEAKERDALRRYNPPISSAFHKTVEERGLIQNKCPNCWRSGYDTIRLAQLADPAFFCTCGHPIL
jgi:Aspartyl/Asparaginyl beta-hydroxylase